jgi:hypothetical protein
MRNLPQRSLTWLVGVSCTLGFFLPVQAETQLSIATRAAEIRNLQSYARTNAACTGIEPPPIYIEEPPAHGIVCLRRTTVLLTKVEENNLSHCLGRKVPGVSVVYLARGNYVGGDIVRYSVRFPAVTLSVLVNLTVSSADSRSPRSMPPDISDPGAETIQVPGPIPSCTALVS